MIELEFWHWWGAAAALGALDMLARRGYFLWLGVAALIVGLVVCVFPDLPILSQALVFAGIAIVVLVVSRQVIRRGAADFVNDEANRRSHYSLGQLIVLESPIANGRGRAFIGDTLWLVAGEDMPAGTTVKVVGFDGILLKVEAFSEE